MIGMLISGTPKEARYIYERTKDYAGLFTDEEWQIYLCQKKMELLSLLDQNPLLDIVCIDITPEYGIEMAKELRTRQQHAYFILIAGPSISPMQYLRPSIHAEGLMMKPLTKTQVEQVLKESFQSFLQRFESDGQKDAFVVDTRGGRRRVNYDRILYFEAREKKLFLVTEGEEIAFYDTLEHLETILPSHFIRCHRSFVINLHLTEQIALGESSIYLKGGFIIPVSRSYRKALKDTEL